MCGEGQNVELKMTSDEVHCKTTMKTKIKCRKGK
jgi:hypothetical protein